MDRDGNGGWTVNTESPGNEECASVLYLHLTGCRSCPLLPFLMKDSQWEVCHGPWEHTRWVIADP